MRIHTKLALVATAIFSFNFSAAAKYKFIVPHVSNTENYNHLSLEVFKNHLESRSNGQIEVEIYPGGQLCSNAKECLAGVQSGIFDYFQTTVSELAYYWDPMEGFDLPYMLKDDRVAECVYSDGKFLADIRGEVLDATKSLRLMMVSNSGGWRNIATTKKQIKSPADVKGLKLRTVPAAIQQELVKELGGAPTPISWSETYSALSTGLVDGTKNGIVDIIQMRFHESLNNIILDGHAYMGGAWVMNNKKFNQLPDELKKVVLDGIEAQNQYLRSYPKWREFSAYKEFIEAGGKIYNPSAEEKEAFKTATQPVIERYMSKASEEKKLWLQRYQDTITACEKQIDESYEQSIQ